MINIILYTFTRHIKSIRNPINNFMIFDLMIAQMIRLHSIHLVFLIAYIKNHQLATPLCKGFSRCWTEKGLKVKSYC